MHLMHVERARELTDLPNITIVLGEALKRAGIASLADLAKLGAKNRVAGQKFLRSSSIVPHATRAPESPDSWDFKSSRLA